MAVFLKGQYIGETGKTILVCMLLNIYTLSFKEDTVHRQILNLVMQSYSS